MTAKKPGAMKREEVFKLGRAALAAKIPPVLVRFWSKVDIRSDAECWLWKASFRRKDEQYGAFSMTRNSRHEPAHKIAWILANGLPVPEGMVVCHRCDNPPCCNPAHLWIGTPADNDADRVTKGRQCRGSKQKYAVA